MTEQQTWNDKRTYRLWPMPGNGPWRILLHCPSAVHNTEESSMRGAPEHRCICPRARALYAMYLERKKLRDRAQRRAAGGARRQHRKVPETQKLKTPSYFANVAEDATKMPDLSRGRCVTRQSGAQVMARAFGTTASRPTRTATEAAKAMCADCPVRLACASWVTKYEVPAGEWGGVYGGMTAKERIEQRRKVIRGV